MGNGSLIGLPSSTVRCLPFRIKQVENKMGPRSKLYIKYLAYKEYPILPINIIKDKRDTLVANVRLTYQCIVELGTYVPFQAHIEIPGDRATVHNYLKAQVHLEYHR